MLSIAFLFDIAAKATLILAAACLLVLALRRASASARYFTWTCALAALLALPVLSLLLPGWTLPVKTPPAALRAHRPPRVVGPHATAAPRPSPVPAPPPRSPPDEPSLAAAIWLAGVFLRLARLAAGHFRLAWSLRRTRGLDAPDWHTGRDSRRRPHRSTPRDPLVLQQRDRCPAHLRHPRHLRGAPRSVRGVGKRPPPCSPAA